MITGIHDYSKLQMRPSRALTLALYRKTAPKSNFWYRSVNYFVIDKENKTLRLDIEDARNPYLSISI